MTNRTIWICCRFHFLNEISQWSRQVPVYYDWSQKSLYLILSFLCQVNTLWEISWLFHWCFQALLFLQYYHILHIKKKLQNLNKLYLQAIKTITTSQFTVIGICLCAEKYLFVNRLMCLLLPLQILLSPFPRWEQQIIKYA